MRTLPPNKCVAKRLIYIKTYMNKKLPISVFIITKNEEDRITDSINSVINLVDEVIVIDSGSNDKTVPIAKKLGAKVIETGWPGYVKQKVYGESLCKNEWILNIDADEALSLELQNEIKDLFSQKSLLPSAYRLKIRLVHRLSSKTNLFSPTNSPIRLYHKDFAKFNDDEKGICHDAVILFDNHFRPLTLNNIVLHRSGRSLSHLIEKANFYSTCQAEEMFKKGRRVSFIRLFFEFPFQFLKVYFWRRYFSFGLIGFVDSITLAYARFLRLAKLYELQKTS
jgi:glycosyltransferase involved in cell wall biosynthesis